MQFHLACIVEGQGDLEAVPVLVRRIAHVLAPGTAVQVHPFRVGRNKLLKEGELERAVELAARRAGRDGGILILLDSDDDCPAKLGPALLQRAVLVRSDIRIRVVLAHREFEAWFLAGGVLERSPRAPGKPDEPGKPRKHSRRQAVADSPHARRSALCGNPGPAGPGRHPRLDGGPPSGLLRQAVA